MSPAPRRDVTFLDVFSGAGGMSLGFEEAGFRCVGAIDVDHYSCMTYRRNFPDVPVFERRVEEMSDGDVLRAAGRWTPDVVVGGPPCQGFSIAGRPGRTFVDDPRNHLFKEFVRVTALLKPRFFIMENVSRMYSHNSGKTHRQIKRCFEELGYRVSSRVLNAAEYGIPQKRSRIFIIGNRMRVGNPFPGGGRARVPVREALDGLPRLESGGSSEVPNHVAMEHSPQMLRKMSYVRDGGDRSQIPARYRPRGGDIRKYIRYDSGRPSVCVTGDMRKVFHYSQNRALTVRELARLQSFPDSFVFEGGSLSQQQQVGNAVPPALARAVAAGVRGALRGDGVAWG